MGKRLTKEEFVEKARKVHGDLYDYSLVEYKSAHGKVKIICQEHGEFEQNFNNHVYNGKGCPKCNGGVRLTTEEFIERAIKVHGELYDYNLVEYVSNNKKVIIICKVHGEFEQTPNSHLNGSGCSKCANMYNRINKSDTIDMFIKKAEKIHGLIYGYSKCVYVNAYIKVKILCKKCDIFFHQTPNDHLMGSGCSKCKSSKGELKIEKYLKENNIKFINQKTFRECKAVKRYLPFDFYLPEYNILVEYDGMQHFKPIKYFGGVEAFQKRQKYDKFKTDYCLKNNIKLIRIPYTEFKNVEIVLHEELKNV